MAVTNKQKQVKEIIRCGKDPVYFMQKYVKIQHPTRGLIPFETYPFQETCVADFENNRFNIILKSRQLGLSTLSASYALWMGIFQRDKNILVIATKLNVAMNFIRKVKTMLRSLPKWLVLPEVIADNKQTIEFSHGSVIKAIPTSDDAGRSEALSLLIVDEAAFVKNFDTLWMGLYPTLSTGGRAIVLSTPNGVGGQYYKLYTDAVQGENEFNPINQSHKLTLGCSP
jgi:phage FluMu gp28-like protein